MKNQLFKHHLFWPVTMLAALLLFNLIYSPDFFKIVLREGHLYGSLIDILNFGAPLILVAIGMTLVIATKGIDLSVGSIVAISGAVACMMISKGADQSSLSLVLTAIAAALGLSLVLGLWNGFLVTGAGIQPIIATLILMVAGRGIAQLVTSGQIITVSSDTYEYIGTGSLATLPFSIFVVAFMLIIASLLTRRTALGLFIESVGSNPKASLLSGVRSSVVILAVYIFCGLCAGIAGLLLSSNVSSADGNNAGLWYELDAILAVVIGGTSLNGGRFYLMGTVIGALIIQTLTTTIYMIGVPPEITLVVKAFVVLAVCLVQSEAFRQSLVRRWKTRHYPGEKEVVRRAS
ncbi:simple sugar transport system permease protein [Paenibacillus phyllosphaerae]|uniref:Simple sugar transport system permease protein n=1 Tax=Paenibacillus phyllosphaerae TaxID=274593 RepID=A0A7W5B2C1_9BACL|nr:ABC transporter permease [Paenibacillus phyllosphaerae]MBB3112884.1 simple sugar transport system permease protein [Paenibacillus phyllosphaerae]